MFLVEDVGKWFMICEDCEVLTFDCRSEMADCFVHAQEFSVWRGPFLLPWIELFREEAERLPLVVDELL